MSSAAGALPAIIHARRCPATSTHRSRAGISTPLRFAHASGTRRLRRAVALRDSHAGELIVYLTSSVPVGALVGTGPSGITRAGCFSFGAFLAAFP